VKVTPEPITNAVGSKRDELQNIFDQLPPDQQERLRDQGAALNIL